MDTILCDASTADDAVTGDVGNGSDGPIQGVATAFPDVTAAAASVLESGGNAADAAAAAAWSLSVCEPSGSGLGGHTTVLVRTAEGAVMALEGVSRAPMAASRKTISRAEQHKGRKAATVPSTPAVLAELSTEFGRLGVAAALEPAVAEVTMRPAISVSLDAQDAERMLRMLDQLEDLDDVQQVYSNADISDEILAGIA